MTTLAHWVVGLGARPDTNAAGLRYRRHRLAAYLNMREDTDRVYWVSFKRRMRQSTEITQLEGGIWEIVLRDASDLRRFAAHRRMPDLLVSHLKRTGVRNVLWYTYPAFPALARQDDWLAVAYDSSDLWSGWTGVVPARSGLGRPRDWKRLLRMRCLAKAESEIVNRATHVVSTTECLSHSLEARYGRGADQVVENGVDFARFAASDESGSQHPPVLVYAGALKATVDFELLKETARALPVAELRLVGPVRPESREDLANLLREPNISHQAAIAYEDVAQILSKATIGLLPYRATDWTRAASPLKLFEYLAAGIPAIGIGVPTTAKYQERDVYFHADDRASFVAECQRLVEHVDLSAGRATRRAVAADHDWQPKLESIFNAVVSSHAPGGSGR